MSGDVWGCLGDGFGMSRVIHEDLIENTMTNL